MVLKLFSGYLSLSESPLTSRVLPRLFHCALELCFCQDRCFWSFACGVVVGWGERGDTRAHLILYPRVCLITYIHGIAAAQLALSAHAKRCLKFTLEIIFPSAMRQTLLKRRCPIDLSTSPFARTPHPPMALPPLSRSAARHKADEAVAKHKAAETHMAADTHTAGETQGCM